MFSDGILDVSIRDTGLNEQLEDLLGKRFVRPSVLRWITPGLLVTKRMDD